MAGNAGIEQANAATAPKNGTTTVASAGAISYRSLPPPGPRQEGAGCNAYYRVAP